MTAPTATWLQFYNCWLSNIYSSHTCTDISFSFHPTDRRW